MTALLSYVRAAELMTDPASRADERLAGTLHKAGAEAGRAAAVLRRLREFYRGEGARLEPTDALAVCARVAQALQDRMRRGGVEFEMRHPNDVPHVMFDRTQLEIIMHNLLTNSLDAFDSVPVRESGLRRILNFGHTVGHALEAGFGYHRYLHGEAVAIGMVAAARLSETYAGLSAAEAARLRTLIEGAGLPVELPSEWAGEEFSQALKLDKKRAGDAIEFVLLDRLGHALTHRINSDEIIEHLAEQ